MAFLARTSVLAVSLLLQSATFTVDRLVAVVGGDPIFLSDVRDVVRLRLFDPAAMLAPLSESANASDEERALQRLINRRLVLAEASRYSQAQPSEADVAAALALWQSRMPDPPPHDAAAVRAFLVDSLRIERYLSQRFTSGGQPTRDAALGDWLRGLRERAAVRILR